MIIWKSRITSDLGNMITESCNAFWCVNKNIMIFGPTPNIKEFGSLPYRDQIFTSDIHRDSGDERVSSYEHSDWFASKIWEIEIVRERSICQAIVYIEH